MAVVGASRHADSLGRQVLDNLLAGDFQGPVYPVNPNAEYVRSIRCYPDLEALPEAADLVVVATPAPTVEGIARQAAATGSRGMVVISAGFKEVGGEGEAREARLREAVEGRLRLVGPNCMGVIDTSPDVRLNATFSARAPLPGGVAFASQSGALGEAILAEMRDRHIGLASFVSLGNKMDVTANDLLELWADDPRVEVILLYLESFGDPARFLPLARRVTRGKPVVAVKAGRTAAGARAAGSHTGAVADAEVAAAQVLRQAGVLRARSIEEMFDMATAFSHAPLPAGRRVALLTNAGGPGILATDAAIAEGLTMARLGEETTRDLSAALSEAASVANPVDMIAHAGPEEFAACQRALVADEGVDAVVTIFVSPATMDTPAVASAVVDNSAGGKPVLAVFMGRTGHDEAVARLRAGGLPVYEYPESAARSLAALCTYRERRDEPRGEPVRVTRDLTAARAALDSARGAGREWLSPAEADGLLAAYSVPTIPWEEAADPAAAVAAACRLGFPCVVKVSSAAVVHKTDVGGVAVGLADEGEVEEAATGILRRAADDPQAGLVVQAMGQGVEVLCGLSRHDRLGALVAFGMGGVLVEVLRDVATRVAPLTDRDAERMVDEIRGGVVLRGYRGAPPADLCALRSMLLALSAMAGDFPEIAELDLNPVFAAPPGGRGGVADVRVRLG